MPLLKKVFTDNYGFKVKVKVLKFALGVTLSPPVKLIISFFCGISLFKTTLRQILPSNKPLQAIDTTNIQGYKSCSCFKPCIEKIKDIHYIEIPDFRIAEFLLINIVK